VKTNIVKPRVLIISDYFFPGYRAGGPIQSLRRITECEEKFDLRVLTRDHDLNSLNRYEIAERFSFVKVGEARVGYLQSSIRDFLWAIKSIFNWKPEVIYLNSLFSVSTLFLLVLIRFLPRCQTVIAPRGQCHPQALAQSRIKKYFVSIFIKVSIPRNVIFEASSAFDQEHIQIWLGPKLVGQHRLMSSANISASPSRQFCYNRPDESPFHVIFASRIVQKKGLIDAIQILRDFDKDIVFTIYGVVEDEKYWKSCLRLLSELPSKIAWQYGGEYRQDQVDELFKKSDLFLFPTKGENFGQIIGEALSVGCPTVTSDQTFWTNAFKCRGFTAASNKDAQMKAISELYSMSRSELCSLRENLWQSYGLWFAQQSSLSILNQVLPK
jgi:glycosyltransferase involved in cell wall biosynthesis